MSSFDRNYFCDRRKIRIELFCARYAQYNKDFFSFFPHAASHALSLQEIELQHSFFDKKTDIVRQAAVNDTFVYAHFLQSIYADWNEKKTAALQVTLTELFPRATRVKEECVTVSKRSVSERSVGGELSVVCEWKFVSMYPDSTETPLFSYSPSTMCIITKLQEQIHSLTEDIKKLKVSKKRKSTEKDPFDPILDPFDPVDAALGL
jgi:hypothetical protein